MSVLYHVDAVPVWMDAPAPWTCEKCAWEIEPPCVVWQGARTMLFHPECAAALGPHLIADAREATLAADSAPHWRRRLVAGVRHRLECEEAVA